MPKNDWWWRKHSNRLWAAITFRYNAYPPSLGMSATIQFKPTLCLDLWFKIWRHTLYVSVGTRFKTAIPPKSTSFVVKPTGKPNPEGYAPQAPEE
jgi:hypothetical protein